MTGSSVRRSAVISLVSISACCELIRSVDDQLSPSINGGSPVFATSCSKICRTGVSLSRIWLSAPMALIDHIAHRYKVAHAAVSALLHRPRPFLGDLLGALLCRPAVELAVLRLIGHRKAHIAAAVPVLSHRVVNFQQQPR